MFDGGANKDKEFAGYEPEAPLAQPNSIQRFNQSSHFVSFAHSLFH